MNPIISVHLPKTAGTSFVHALEECFGNRILLDYDDMPMRSTPKERATNAIKRSVEIADAGLQEKMCVHGHFLPVKYLLLSLYEKLSFVTWMRHPFERAISHYNYWSLTYDPVKSPLHQKEVVESFSIEEFCLSEKFRNIYSQYLWGFPLENFEFIGITEYFNEDFRYFTKNWLSKDIVPEMLNISGAEINIDIGLKKVFEEFHKKDMDLYNRALEMRMRRN